tara:strand:+ start:206 stop:379 length:174 start_codon:yes stop_codon:yes gene_type:complete
MESNEVYLKLVELWTEFSIEHSKTSKAAHGRARKALTEIKKLISVYKKSSVAEDKAK